MKKVSQKVVVEKMNKQQMEKMNKQQMEKIKGGAAIDKDLEEVPVKPTR
jgi:hypothetical protein